MTFEAKYGGRCGVCDAGITPGDACAYVEDVVVHADCEQAATRAGRRAPAPICGRCFIETATNGKCGCDE